MRFIHRYTAKAPLPKMSRPLFARMYPAGISAMHFRQRTAQGINMIGNQHKMHMIWHQHPTPNRNAVRSALHRQQITISRIVLCRKESLLPPIAALRHMVGYARNYISSQSRHERTFSRAKRHVN